jgi:hypothetical protein
MIKRIGIINILTALLVCCADTVTLAEVSTNHPGLRVVTLQGSPYNRGLVHGQSLKKEIHELVVLWKADLEKEYKMKPEAFIARFLKKTDFTQAIKQWTPEL